MRLSPIILVFRVRLALIAIRIQNVAHNIDALNILPDFEIFTMSHISVNIQNKS